MTVVEKLMDVTRTENETIKVSTSRVGLENEGQGRDLLSMLKSSSSVLSECYHIQIKKKFKV